MKKKVKLMNIPKFSVSQTQNAAGSTVITTNDNVIRVQTSTGSYMVEMSETSDSSELEPPAPLFIAPINTQTTDVKVIIDSLV